MTRAPEPTEPKASETPDEFANPTRPRLPPGAAGQRNLIGSLAQGDRGAAGRTGEAVDVDDAHAELPFLVARQCLGRAPRYVDSRVGVRGVDDDRLDRSYAVVDPHLRARQQALVVGGDEGELDRPAESALRGQGAQRV